MTNELDLDELARDMFMDGEPDPFNNRQPWWQRIEQLIAELRACRALVAEYRAESNETWTAIRARAESAEVERDHAEAERKAWAAAALVDSDRAERAEARIAAALALDDEPQIATDESFILGYRTARVGTRRALAGGNQ